MELTPLDPENETKLARLFAPADQDQARTLLITECGENIPMWSSAGMERLRAAVLKLSEGKLDKLQSSINLAKRDFRDVLVWAGFGGTVEEHRSWQPERKW